MNNSPDTLTPTLSRREREQPRPTLEVRGLLSLTRRWLRHPLSLGERDRVRGRAHASRFNDFAFDAAISPLPNCKSKI